MITSFAKPRRPSDLGEQAAKDHKPWTKPKQRCNITTEALKGHGMRCLLRQTRTLATDYILVIIRCIISCSFIYTRIILVTLVEGVFFRLATEQPPQPQRVTARFTPNNAQTMKPLNQILEGQDVFFFSKTFQVTTSQGEQQGVHVK